MQNSPQLLTRGQYAAIVKPLLPAEAFALSMRKLWQCVAHLGVIALCIWGIREWTNVLARFALSATIGHSLTCLVFLAHELSHGAMMGRSRTRYLLEVFLWGLNMIPATMWRKLHNENHHAHANTLNDPDRYFRQSELDAPGGRWRWWYARFFMPHRWTSRWNLGVGFHFVTYILRHLATVFYPGAARPAIVTFKPDYRAGDRWRIVFEVACIVALQVGIYFAVGRSLGAYLWAGPIALLFTSTYAMSYIWTNHYLHGLAEIHDPLLGSTSIDVPPLFDRLHSNFSYHTEHHLFPSMSSDYYPLVSKILREHFPERYHRLSYRQAWRKLWRGELYIVEETAAASAAPTIVDTEAAALAGPHQERATTKDAHLAPATAAGS
ncbi:MAG: fatty acid desaturase [Pirellulales bacterium]